MRLILAAAVAALATAASAPGQSQTPFTFTKVDLKRLEEAEALDRQLEKRALVYHDAALEKHLADLAAGMLPDTPLEHVDWKFRILRDPMVNAFGLPNGSVYLFTGLLARAENDDQLAGVLAHEIAHVANRHDYIFNRSLRRKVVISEGIAIAADWTPMGSWGIVVAEAANFSQLAIVDLVYGYSRKLEEEADRNGVDRMQRTKRDPAQMVRMFEILDDKLEPEPVPRFFWDHPKTRDRVAYLREIAGGGEIAPENNRDYVSRMREVMLQNMQLDLGSRRFRSAVAAGQQLVNANPDDAVALYWVGESWRSLGPREPRLTEQERTDGGLRKGYRQTVRRTEEEDTKALAAMVEGRTALEASQRKAEEFFREAARVDASLPEPYFGLGALYQDQGKTEPALDAYRRYIELCQQPGEKERAKRRIEEIAKSQERVRK